MRFSVVFIQDGVFIDSLINSLNKQRHFIHESFATFPTQKIDSLNIDDKNMASHLNQAVENTTSTYLLLLHGNIQLEDETLQEFAEMVEEYPDADIIYPNEVFMAGEEEEIKNYNDWYQKEQLLLPSLAIEDYIPQWGVLIKKETIQKLGGFEPKYNDHTWYAFIYKNLDKLHLKLSELSFINHYLTETFIDTSYRSLLVRDIVTMHQLQEIFTSLDWRNENIALATAFTLIGDRLAKYYDFFNASKFYRNALLAFHNQATLQKLLDVYIQMGLFQEAKTLLQTQGATQKIYDEYQEKIETTDKLIKELEKAIEAGKAADILAASHDIVSFYKGAPIYNILGVIAFMRQEFNNAYQFFYKAATMNPLDQDILHNLAEVAKKIDKEKEVINLYERLTKG